MSRHNVQLRFCQALFWCVRLLSRYSRGSHSSARSLSETAGVFQPLSLCRSRCDEPSPTAFAVLLLKKTIWIWDKWSIALPRWITSPSSASLCRIQLSHLEPAGGRGSVRTAVPTESHKERTSCAAGRFGSLPAAVVACEEERREHGAVYLVIVHLTHIYTVPMWRFTEVSFFLFHVKVHF